MFTSFFIFLITELTSSAVQELLSQRFVPSNNECTGSHSKCYISKEAVPHELSDGILVSFAGITFALCVPLRQIVPPHGVHHRRNRSANWECKSSSQPTQDASSECLKNLLMRALNAVESPDMLGRPLSIQVGEHVAFVHILFAIFLGKLCILRSRPTNSESVREGPKSSAQEYGGRDGGQLTCRRVE